MAPTNPTDKIIVLITGNVDPSSLTAKTFPD
jgi:hypothetical protein